MPGDDPGASTDDSGVPSDDAGMLMDLDLGVIEVDANCAGPQMCDPVSGSGCNDCFSSLPYRCAVSSPWDPASQMTFCTPMNASVLMEGGSCSGLACPTGMLCGEPSSSGGFRQPMADGSGAIDGHCRQLCASPGTTTGCPSGRRCVALDGQTRYGACVP
jgi:hypothetical protein